MKFNKCERVTENSLKDRMSSYPFFFLFNLIGVFSLNNDLVHCPGQEISFGYNNYHPTPLVYHLYIPGKIMVLILTLEALNISLSQSLTVYC